MCVLAFAWQADRRWPLVLAGNRDEAHSRPAQPLERWPDSPVIAGRDLLSGGSWLGVSDGSPKATGRLAVVTNLRGFGGPHPDRASRGALVSDWLAGAGAYGDLDETRLGDFNPFNLITVKGGAAEFWSNAPRPIRSPLGPGLYGLSNGALDEPWSKTVNLRGAVQAWLDEDGADPDALFGALADETPDPNLTPDDDAIRRKTSAIFIRSPVYGTRCSTVVTVDAKGRGRIAERRFDPSGAVSGATSLDFAW